MSKFQGVVSYLSNLVEIMDNYDPYKKGITGGQVAFYTPKARVASDVTPALDYLCRTKCIERREEGGKIVYYNPNPEKILFYFLHSVKQDHILDDAKTLIINK